MAIVLKNNATTTISNDILASDTSITVPDGSIFSAVASPDWFWCTIIDAVDETVLEIVKVTDITGNVLTVERGSEGTTALPFSADSIIEQRVTRQTLLDLSGGTAPAVTKERDYLDTMHLVVKNGPINNTGNKVGTYNKKFAPKLVNDWINNNRGLKLKNIIYDNTNGVVLADEMVFNTLDDVATWVTNNTNNNTASIVMKPYETISDDIPVMTTCYGVNRLFSAMKGHKMYKKTGSTCNDSGISNTEFDKITSAVLGASANANVKKVVWIPNSKKNIYGTLHKSGKVMHSTTGGGQNRWYWDSSDDSFHDMADHSDFMRANVKPKIAAISTGGTNIQVQDQSHIDPYYNNGPQSRVLVYQLQKTTNAQHQAIFVKPIGMDTFVLEMPDFSNYSLDLVAYNDNIQGGVITKTINSFADFWTSDQDAQASKMRIDLSNFMQVMMNKATQSSLSTYSEKVAFNTVRLRLRNKTTNEVGKLSPFGIVYEMNHTFNTFRLIVKNFNK